VGFASAALACVVGGAASTLWLGAGYALSGAAGVVGTIAALGLADVRGAAERAGAGRGEWARFARNFTRPRLLWVFVFAVAMQVVNHVPLEFHQPYLEAAGVDFGGGERPTLAAGLVLGAMMLLGAFASRASPRFGERFGERRALLATFMLQCAIVWTMAAVVHPLVAVVIAARGVPHGLAQPLRNVMVHRELDGNLRATWFSLQSLVGSAVFSLTLFASAGVIASGTASLAAGELGRVLTGYGVGAALVLVCLAIPRLR
jgi:hypothetical protein